MRIESGTTNERLARCGIIALALGFFAAWFAYDGWVRYPRKSMEVFQTDLKLKELPRPHPRLGYIDPQKPRTRYKAGLAKAEILAELGEPLKVEPSVKPDTEHWHYIGQFGRLDLEVDKTRDNRLGRVTGAAWEQTPADYREDSIKQQKFFFIACGVLALLGAIAFVVIWRTRVVVDESGLAYNRRAVGWDAMTELDSTRYHAKGWLHLVYRDGERFRRLKLDSFKIDAFDEVVDAICQKKGFANPIPLDEPLESGEETEDDEVRDNGQAR
jgi:hypothetical protein